MQNRMQKRTNKTNPAKAGLLGGLMIAGLAACLLLAGCDLDPQSPPALNAGSADFTRIVAVGNSLTAGYQSGGLVEDFQAWAYPAMIARQAGLTVGNDGFSYPNISYPGISPLLHLVSPVGPVIQPISTTSMGTPTNTAFQGVYSNLGVPGATAGQFTANPAVSPQSLNPFFQIVARPTGFDSASVANLAVAAQPTFIIVWAGNNDALGAATSGEPAALTSVSAFEDAIEDLLVTLSASGAEMVMANIPDVTSIPFTTTILPFVLNPATQEPIPLIGETDTGTPGLLDPLSLVLLTASDSLAHGVGIPAAVPGGTGRPLPDSMVLTPIEKDEISARVGEFNAIIAAEAAERNIPVADMNSLMAGIADDGYPVAGVELSADFVTGGIFSLDGVHPTTIGYGIVANEFIRTINAHYGSNLQEVDLNALMGMPTVPSDTAGFAVGRGIQGDFRFTSAAAEQVRRIFNQD